MNLLPNGLVSARDVHDNAKLTTTFQKWGQRNFTNNPQMQEGVDYKFARETSPGPGRTSHEFYITPEVAINLINESRFNKSDAALKTKEVLQNLIGIVNPPEVQKETTQKPTTEVSNNDTVLERAKESLEISSLLVEQAAEYINGAARTILSMVNHMKDQSELIVELLSTKDKPTPIRTIGVSGVTTREVIHEVVNKEAQSSGSSHHAVWKGLYSFYTRRHGVDLRAANKKEKKRSVLDLAISRGLSAKLEACVKDKYTASYNAVMMRTDAVPTRKGLELPINRDKTNPLPDELPATNIVAGINRK